MAKKDKHKQLPREDQAPPAAARLEAEAGPPREDEAQGV